MVEIKDIVTARILENNLIKQGFTFWWFTKTLEGNYSIAISIDRRFYPNRDYMYENMTKGIDKKHNRVLSFIDEYECKYELIIQDGNSYQYDVLNTILKGLGIR